MKSVSLLNARSGTLVVRPGASPDGEPAGLHPEHRHAARRRRDRPGPGGTRPRLQPAGRTGPPRSRRLPPRSSSPSRSRRTAARSASSSSPTRRTAPAASTTSARRTSRILSLFGNQAAIALENARLHRDAVEKEKMEREIEIAASIQRAILPTTLPAVNGILIAAGNRPTKQVGGDFYDVYPAPRRAGRLLRRRRLGKGNPGRAPRLDRPRLHPPSRGGRGVGPDGARRPHQPATWPASRRRVSS